MGVEWYSIDEFVGDVVGVVDVFGYEMVYVVGYDWGGVVVWWIVLYYLDWVCLFIVMNFLYLMVFV